MTAYLVWSLIVLVLAIGVLILAGTESGETWSIREFVRDLRSGVTARRRARSGQPLSPNEVEDEPVDISMEALFRETSVDDDDAYLRVDEITETLTRAKDMALRGVHGLTHH